MEIQSPELENWPRPENHAAWEKFVARTREKAAQEGVDLDAIAEAGDKRALAIWNSPALRREWQQKREAEEAYARYARRQDWSNVGLVSSLVLLPVALLFMLAKVIEWFVAWRGR